MKSFRSVVSGHISALLLVGAAAACGSPDIKTGNTGGAGLGGGNGNGGGAGGGLGNIGGGYVLPGIDAVGGGGNRDGSADPGDKCDSIAVTFRDFNPTHPDFESFSGNNVTPGLVAVALGGDKKPVFGNACTTPGKTDACPYGQQMTSQERFDQWYRDVDGVNKRIEDRLTLSPVAGKPGYFVYESSAFFPLNGKGWNEGMGGNNFSFTTEIHGTFKYRGGEIFRFTGDDDVWVFVNGKLAIDVGGLHPKQDRTADFDMMAGQLGITKGNTYSLDVFHAERHTNESNFRIETSIECLKTAPID